MREIVDLNTLVEVVRKSCTNHDSYLHGESHWRCVAWMGMELLRDGPVPAADPAVVFLFGLLHDCQRLNDGHDKDHGRRAAAFVLSLADTHLRLSAAQLHLLHDACAGHVDGFNSTDPTIGACWDADRLNLWRINVTPAAKLLSTAAARHSRIIERASRLPGGDKSWTEILSAYETLRR